MGAALSLKRGKFKGKPSKKLKELADRMSEKDLRDFAKKAMAKEAGLKELVAKLRAILGKGAKSADEASSRIFDPPTERIFDDVGRVFDEPVKRVFDEPVKRIFDKRGMAKEAATGEMLAKALMSIGQGRLGGIDHKVLKSLGLRMVPTGGQVAKAIRDKARTSTGVATNLAKTIFSPAAKRKAILSSGMVEPHSVDMGRRALGDIAQSVRKYQQHQRKLQGALAS